IFRRSNLTSRRSRSTAASRFPIRKSARSFSRAPIFSRPRSALSTRARSRRPRGAFARPGRRDRPPTRFWQPRIGAAGRWCSGDGHAMRFVYTRDTNRYDIFSHYIDYSPNFRADNGFVPWAQLHGVYFEIGGHAYPKSGFVSFIRPFVGIGKESAWHGGSAGFYLEVKYGINGWIGF